MTTNAKIALPDGVDCDVNTFYVSFITIPYSYFDKGRGKSARDNPERYCGLI